jgi:hypothetical protein
MMAALIPEHTVQVLALAAQAHSLLNQFALDQEQRPERAWESLAELQELLDQLRAMYPFRAFRHRRI